jgi:hypothetical protein
MNFFDFFFPKEAAASHLRTLAEQGRRQSESVHRERVQTVQQARRESVRTQSQEQRIAQVEADLGQAGLAIEALIQLLEKSGTLTREALAACASEIDGKDGKVDGRMTPPPAEEFVPSRPWPGKAQA